MLARRQRLRREQAKLSSSGMRLTLCNRRDPYLAARRLITRRPASTARRAQLCRHARVPQILGDELVPAGQRSGAVREPCMGEGETSERARRQQVSGRHVVTEVAPARRRFRKPAASPSLPSAMPQTFQVPILIFAGPGCFASPILLPLPNGPVLSSASVTTERSLRR